MTTQQSADDQLRLGEIIRRQRELAALSMRQVAAMAGISNPYLSQIERGLRAPSEEVLRAIAESLDVSADLLRGDKPEDASAEVIEAIQLDPDLTASQRRSLIEAYQALRRVTLKHRRVRVSR
ncbi:MAG TPA: helix-turn-helix transcriptional regulator [Propionibacteriaceae bacterium]|nr:helix-turn-helix transcriptional regulator [Propionibacteriaceae bacterium]